MKAIPTILIILIFLSHFTAIGLYFLFIRNKPSWVCRFASTLIAVSFLCNCITLALVAMNRSSVESLSLFYISGQNLLLATLINFMSLIIHRFSLRHMNGDRLYYLFFMKLSLLSITSISMALADNLFLFCLSLLTSNLLLIKLMIHKPEWSAAKNSGQLAYKTLISGNMLLFIGCSLLWLSQHSISMQNMTMQYQSSKILSDSLALMFILIAAMMQSAQWPFQGWLISSLNSPTPVSALMHAGLVNGGGIIIVKFSSLYSTHPHLLTTVFIFGALTALIGSLWQLMQWNIKSMLACSTMAQMGFMMMQCGLGLFAAAIGHICWHAAFKAYHFLSTANVIKEKRNKKNTGNFTVKNIIISIVGGWLGVYSFAFISATPLWVLQAETFLLAFVFITGMQLTLNLMKSSGNIKLLSFSLVFVSLMGGIYGGSFRLIKIITQAAEPALSPLRLSPLHGLVFFLFFSLWIFFNIGVIEKIKETDLWARLYMRFMNASLPAPQTVTAKRSRYFY